MQSLSTYNGLESFLLLFKVSSLMYAVNYGISIFGYSVGYLILSIEET